MGFARLDGKPSTWYQPYPSRVRPEVSMSNEPVVPAEIIVEDKPAMEAASFVMVPNSLLELVAAQKIKPEDLAVYCAIRSHLNTETGQCNPSELRLAKMLGISERTVRRSLRRLLVAQVIARKRTRRLSANYVFPDARQVRPGRSKPQDRPDLTDLDSSRPVKSDRSKPQDRSDLADLGSSRQVRSDWSKPQERSDLTDLESRPAILGHQDRTDLAAKLDEGNYIVQPLTPYSVQMEEEEEEEEGRASAPSPIQVSAPEDVQEAARTLRSSGWWRATEPQTIRILLSDRKTYPELDLPRQALLFVEKFAGGKYPEGWRKAGQAINPVDMWASELMNAEERRRNHAERSKQRGLAGDHQSTTPKRAAGASSAPARESGPWGRIVYRRRGAEGGAEAAAAPQPRAEVPGDQRVAAEGAPVPAARAVGS